MVNRTFHGQGVTPGTVRGILFAAHNIDDIARCPLGGILLLRFATPDIILAFGRAAAIVTEVGGITSHAAILARENGTPCIVAVDGLFDEDLSGKQGTLFAEDGILEVESEHT
jgi:pyruvate, water dikinase